MKRVFAVFIALALLVLPIVSSRAAETGELQISSEKVPGDVGQIVKVNFYLYPNLPDGKKLGSIQGTMKYDPDFVTLGAINQSDASADLSSWMNGRAKKFEYNNVPGLLKFGFFDAYGAEDGGFWFQAEFRIEKEGATDFVFNGIEYTGIDDAYATVSYFIQPVSVGGIYTKGKTVPTSAPNETFSPLSPDSPVPTGQTPTATATAETSPTGTAATTPTATVKVTATAKATAAASPSQSTTKKPTATPSPTVAAVTATPVPQTRTDDSFAEASPTDKTGGPEDTPTDVPLTPQDTVSVEPEQSEQPPDPEKETIVEEEDRKPNMLLFTGVLGGLIALVSLTFILIILAVKRRRKENE